jgi:GDP-4-dehydro-6-deoxy-D-mannose reductase
VCNAPRGRLTVKTIFVTGAEGFAGSRLVRHLSQHGYEVVGGVRNRARKLAFEKQSGKALVCDVSDAIHVARVIASVKPDGLVHLAGLSRPHRARQEPLEAYQSIVTAWANVLDAVRRVTPRARVLLVSSCEVYGHSGDNGQPLAEDAPLRPANAFGALKATGESIAQTFFKNFHLNLSIARPFHYTGPGQSADFFFGALARRIVTCEQGEGQSVVSLPDLDCRRELLHVDDVVEAYRALLDQGQPNEVYNVSSGQTRTVRELCQTLTSASGTSLTIQPEQTHDQPVTCYCGDGGKIQEHAGWRPTRTPEQALRDLLQSWKRQQTEVTT